MRIGIIGYGTVGKALVEVFREDGHDVLINEVEGYDVTQAPEEYRDSFSGKSLMVHTCDVIFVCVPTPLDPQTRRLDTGYVERVLAMLYKWQRQTGAFTCGHVHTPLIVIKSTAPVGFTDSMQKEFPSLWLAFCPEFLRHNHAVDDARQPDRIIVGTSDDAAKERLGQLFHNYYCPIYYVDPKTAELSKLLSNAYLSTKVAFSQQIKKAVELFKLGTFPLELITSDPRIEASHLDPDKGRIPMDSACLPKDLSELRQSMYYNDFFDVVYREAVDNGEPQET